MRHEIQKQQIQELFIELAKRCKGPGQIYVVGGCTAVLNGWRESTVDVEWRPSLGTFHKYELPGEDLILKGLDDLSRREKTIESLLICIAATRLKNAGLEFTPLELDDFAEIHLYRLLSQENSDTAHARMNDYVRRLVSFENALEQRKFQ